MSSHETARAAGRDAVPQVSVIIASYNRSGPLRYAISSVLAQTFRDFEVLVVGDCCTDDSETVVRGFDDPRVSWTNLPFNSGNQYAPNNHGLASARGRYVAYLGHDDLWHREHLAQLVAAIEENAGDLAFSLTLDIGPPSNPTRHVMGLCPNNVYEWPIWPPPSSWLHRRDIVDRIGCWRDYQSIVLPTDVDFFSRIVDYGMRIVAVAELTTFKLTSVSRTQAYLDQAGEEQAAWWERISRDGELQYREALAALAEVAARHADAVLRLNFPSRISAGSLVDNYRARRGLPRLPARGQSKAVPLYDDRPALKLLTSDNDIAPDADRNFLIASSEAPIDGLFVGLNWHSLERDDDGLRWRWMDRDAQIVVTRPSGRTRTLLIELSPGPGFAGRSAELTLRDAEGNPLATVIVPSRSTIGFDVPLPAASGAIYVLDTEAGGGKIPGDPRVLNFRVFGLRWSATDDRESS